MQLRSNCPHCNTPVDEHEASRETDACVAVVVMGERLAAYMAVSRHPSGAVSHYGPFETLEECQAACDKDRGSFRPESRTNKFYSTDIAAAWEVFKKLKDRDDITAITFGGWDGKRWTTYVIAMDIANNDTEASTIQLAICRAALKATING